MVADEHVSQLELEGHVYEASDSTPEAARVGVAVIALAGVKFSGVYQERLEKWLQKRMTSQSCKDGHDKKEVQANKEIELKGEVMAGKEVESKIGLQVKNATQNKPTEPMKTQIQKSGVPPQAQPSGAGVQPQASGGPKVKTIHVKNAIDKLYNLQAGCVFHIVDQTGPISDRMFTMQVLVKGKKYKGTYCNQRGAKLLAAEAALRSMFVWTTADEKLKRKWFDHEEAMRKNKEKLNQTDASEKKTVTAPLKMGSPTDTDGVIVDGVGQSGNQKPAVKMPANIKPSPSKNKQGVNVSGIGGKVGVIGQPANQKPVVNMPANIKPYPSKNKQGVNVSGSGKPGSNVQANNNQGVISKYGPGGKLKQAVVGGNKPTPLMAGNIMQSSLTSGSNMPATNRPMSNPNLTANNKAASLKGRNNNQAIPMDMDDRSHQFMGGSNIPANNRPTSSPSLVAYNRSGSLMGRDNKQTSPMNVDQRPRPLMGANNFPSPLSSGNTNQTVHNVGRGTPYGVNSRGVTARGGRKEAFQSNAPFIGSRGGGQSINPNLQDRVSTGQHFNTGGMSNERFNMVGGNQLNKPTAGSSRGQGRGTFQSSRGGYSGGVDSSLTSSKRHKNLGSSMSYIFSDTSALSKPYRGPSSSSFSSSLGSLNYSGNSSFSGQFQTSSNQNNYNNY